MGMNPTFGVIFHVRDDHAGVEAGWTEHEHTPSRPSLYVQLDDAGGSHVTFAGPPEHVLQLLDDLRAVATEAVDERYPVLSDGARRLAKALAGPEVAEVLP